MTPFLHETAEYGWSESLFSYLLRWFCRQFSISIDAKVFTVTTVAIWNLQNVPFYDSQKTRVHQTASF